MKKLLLFFSLLGTGVATAQLPGRLVVVDGTVAEIVCLLGLETSIVGVDVTSTFPASLGKLPKVGHNRTLSAEGILALKPAVVAGTTNSIRPELLDQLRAAGVKTHFFQQDYSVEGTRRLIREVATAFGMPQKAAPIIARLDADLQGVRKAPVPKKVLFIYARGAGALMVGGRTTPVAKVVALAGGRNAVQEFDDFKPLTPEALLAANPDVILLFTSGLESLGGMNGLLRVPGIAQTTAGRNRKVIEMDGHLLSGFSPRVGLAAQELAIKLR
jgi:iron complex transport system substrate-binding protein